LLVKSENKTNADLRFSIKSFIRLRNIDGGVEHCVLEYVAFLTPTTHTDTCMQVTMTAHVTVASNTSD